MALLSPCVANLLLLSCLCAVEAGPLAYAACQTACNAGAVYCYSQAGLVFGVSVPAFGAVLCVCMMLVAQIIVVAASKSNRNECN